MFAKNEFVKTELDCISRLFTRLSKDVGIIPRKFFFWTIVSIESRMKKLII